VNRRLVRRIGAIEPAASEAIADILRSLLDR
jgi:hypothetical protein